MFLNVIFLNVLGYVLFRSFKMKCEGIKKWRLQGYIIANNSGGAPALIRVLKGSSKAD